jgi:uncharacterized membrane protein
VPAALERLAAEDSSLEIKRLAGREDWRVRVGWWRVLFERGREREIVVKRVLPRGRA